MRTELIQLKYKNFDISTKFNLYNLIRASYKYE